VIRVVCFALGVAGALSNAVARAEPVSIHGSTTVMNLLLLPYKAQIEAASGEQIVIVGNGSQRGLADLAAGKADMAMISAPLEEEVQRISAQQPGALDPTGLAAHPVGQSRVAFVVHPTNSIRALSNEALAEVLVGRITNWKQVGGADEAIIVVAARVGDGVRTMVENRLLHGDSLTKDVRALSNASQIVKVVAQLPGGIGLAPAVSVDESVAELSSDNPITQPLLLVTKGDISRQLQRVIDAVAAAGRH
jgi:phosphate transport system substrate-binding protein